jgi:hypothetical protein
LIDSLRLPIISKVIVIGMDNGGKGGEEQMSPSPQTLNHRQKFSIMDIVPSLSLIQHLRVVAHWTESLLVISLIEDGPSGNLGRIYLHLERAVIVRSLEDRVGLYNLEECIQSLGALIHPFKWSSLLQ